MDKRKYCAPEQCVMEFELDSCLLGASDIKDGAEVGEEVDPEIGFDAKARGSLFEYEW
jgi:hypothetical protein